MPEDKKIVLLVNMNYDDGQQGNVLYEIDEKDAGAAEETVRAAHAAFEAAQEDGSAPDARLSDFTDKALRGAGIYARGLAYAVVDLDC